MKNQFKLGDTLSCLKIMMNVLKILCLNLIITMYGCNGCAEKDDVKTLYTAVNKNDTATLRIKLTDKVFQGQLEINYHGAFKDSGGVTGVVKGDILKGSYRFQHYGIEKWHTRPIALLKKGDKIIMGEGLMEVYMGIYYFKKNRPINYQQPKFVFEKTR